MPAATYSIGSSPYTTVTITVAGGHGLPTGSGSNNVFALAITSISGLLESGTYVAATVASATTLTLTVSPLSDNGTGKLTYTVLLNSLLGSNDWNLEVITKATPRIESFYSSSGIEWDLLDTRGTIGEMLIRDSALFLNWDLVQSRGSISQWDATTDFLSTQWDMLRSEGRMDLGRIALDLTLEWPLAVTPTPEPGQYFITLTAAPPADGEEALVPITPHLATVAHWDWALTPTRTVDFTTVTDVLNDASSMLGFLVATDATPDVQDRLVAAINTAMTAIYAASRRLNAFNSDSLTLTIPATTSSLELPQDVLSITGYAHRLIDGHIVANIPVLTYRSEFDHFLSLWGQPGNTDIQAIYLDSRRDLSTVQAISHTLLVTPAPAVDTTISLDVTFDAPRYTWADYYRNTIIRLPHNYVTALLYPLVRKDVSSHLLFAAQDRLPAIDAQYEDARQLLSLVDPAPTAKGQTS